MGSEMCIRDSPNARPYIVVCDSVSKLPTLRAVAWLAIVAQGPPLAIPFPLSTVNPMAIVLVWFSRSSTLRSLSVYFLDDACVPRLVVHRLSLYRTETRRGCTR